MTTFTYLIGYNEFIPQYCTITSPNVPRDINPLSLTLSKDLQNRIDCDKYLRRKLFQAVGIPTKYFGKKSTNYEDNGKNFKR